MLLSNTVPRRRPTVQSYITYLLHDSWPDADPGVFVLSSHSQGSNERIGEQIRNQGKDPHPWGSSNLILLSRVGESKCKSLRLEVCCCKEFRSGLLGHWSSCGKYLSNLIKNSSSWGRVEFGSTFVFQSLKLLQSTVSFHTGCDSKSLSRRQHGLPSQHKCVGEIFSPR